MTFAPSDPEKLTPAGKRAVKKIRGAFVILAVGMAGAVYGVSHQTATATAQRTAAATTCTARRAIWDFEQRAVVALTAPKPLTDPLLTDQQRALRANNNRAQARTRETLLESLGDRPSC